MLPKTVVWKSLLVMSCAKGSSSILGGSFFPEFTGTLSFADNTPTMDLFNDLMKVSERRGATKTNSCAAKFDNISQKAYK